MNLREQQARQTYETIILTAEQLLEHTSYEQLSVEQICRCAGISKGGFYHHFPSKDQFISILIGRQLGNLSVSRVTPFIDQKNAFELLELYVTTITEFLEEHPKSTLARCWLALTEYPQLRDSILSQNSFQIFHDIVMHGKADGSIRPELDDMFCEAFIQSTVTGILLYGCAFGDYVSLKTFAADALKLICHTLS